MACFVETIGLYAFDLTTQQLGVPSDGITLCTQQLQQAIDSISDSGGGRLTLTRGTYLSGGLMLRSGVELHLEEGATLLGSTNPFDYSLLQKGAVDDGRADNASMALLMADHAEHVAITGKGSFSVGGQTIICSSRRRKDCPCRCRLYYSRNR